MCSNGVCAFQCVRCKWSACSFSRVLVLVLALVLVRVRVYAYRSYNFLPRHCHQPSLSFPLPASPSSTSNCHCHCYCRITNNNIQLLMCSHTQYFQMHTAIIDTNLCSGHIIEMCVLAYVCVRVSRWWFFSRYSCLFVVTHLEWQIFPISDANFRHNPKPSVVRTLRTLFFNLTYTQQNRHNSFPVPAAFAHSPFSKTKVL